ncbi:MAG TPA: type II toxin-antitoxin system Phd/YefM family antitoxin [Stellaceae bacterium]|nr:type II toxin-antitoxin system Phd/YefM family antitoxin [Stellaceae bacterium]
MPVVPASEFSRNFGRYQDVAQREPVAVTRHGRVVGAFISAAEFAHYETLQKSERELLRVGSLPDDVVAAIEAAEFPEEP